MAAVIERVVGRDWTGSVGRVGEIAWGRAMGRAAGGAERRVRGAAGEG